MAPTRRVAIAALALALGSFVVPGSTARAHDLAFTDVLLLVRSDGVFQADLRVDLDALALGASPDADDAELESTLAALSSAELEAVLAGLRNLFERRVRVLGPEPLAFVVDFPDRAAGLVADAQPPSFLGLTARLTGRVPETAASISLRTSRAFPAVRMTVFDENTGATARHLLARGDTSPPFALGSDAQVSSSGQPSVPATVWQYGKLGFEHIVPLGLDHILFVLGLLFLGAGMRPLLLQVSAFTLAHTLSLALATLDVVRVPASVVEPLIALSIVWVGVENLLAPPRLQRRLTVVFGFGLMHGLGFAGVLGELGLPAGRVAASLLGFNLGVEVGQLAVIVAAMAVLLPLGDRIAFRTLARPASLLIALGGLWLLGSRILGL